MVQVPAEHLLGGHVAEFPLEHRPTRLAGRGGAGHAEVRDLHLAVIGHEDVAGRHVPMDDAQGVPVRVARVVSVPQRLADLPYHVQRDGRRDLPAETIRPGHDLLEVPAVDVLHRQVVLALDLVELVDRDDVRMLQRGRDLGLVHEHLHERRVLRIRQEDALDHEDLAKVLGPLDHGLEDLGHPARADLLEQQVLAELPGSRGGLRRSLGHLISRVRPSSSGFLAVGRASPAC